MYYFCIRVPEYELWAGIVPYSNCYVLLKAPAPIIDSSTMRQTHKTCAFNREKPYGILHFGNTMI